MSPLKKFITKLLHLKSLKVANVWFENRYKELHLSVKPYKSGCLCPKCGRRGCIVKGASKKRVWRDIPLGFVDVFFHYAPREIRCKIHGRIQEDVPWAAPYSRETYRFEYLLVRYCCDMSQKKAAEQLRIPKSTISDILHRLIKRGRQGHKIRSLKVIGIDEVSYRKGRRYATVVYDMSRARVVWVGKGKGRSTIDRFFLEELSEYQRANIMYATCDMSRAYMGAIKDHCPNATLVLDRFHIVKALNEAVDEVRKEQWRKLDKDERKAMKGLRWLLYRHSSTRTKKDTRILNSLHKSNRRIYRAWVLKDEFEQFWNYKAPWAADRFLKRWTTAALRSRLEPLRNFAKMIRKHKDNILSFVKTRLTNAVSEGINRIIRMIKNRASGFHTFDAFADMIYLVAGDVDIAKQIPVKNCTSYGGHYAL